MKGFALIPLILFLAVLALAAISGWYFFNNRPEKEPAVLSQQMPSTKVHEEEIAEPPGPTVYTNPDSNFQIKIPQGFSVVEETEEQFHKRSNGEMRQNFTSYVHYAPADFVTSLYVLDKDKNFNKSPLSVWVFENPENLSPEAFYNKYWYYPFVWGDYTQAGKNKIAPNEKFMVGQFEATGAAVLDLDPKFNYIYLGRDGKMYLFRTDPSANILETFNFN